MRCTSCRGVLTGDLKNGRYTYYFCRCRRWYPQSLFDHATVDALRRARIDDELTRKILAHLTEWYDSAGREDTARAQRINQRLAEIETLAAKSYEDKLLGKMADDRWTAFNEKWEAEARQLRAELASLSPSIGRHEFLRRASEPFELLQTAADQYLTQTPEIRGAVVKTCCSNFLVTDGNVSIHLTSPFDVIAKMGESTDWLGRVDSNHRMSAPKTDALPLGDSPTRRE
jgi:hypothetical protein